MVQQSELTKESLQRTINEKRQASLIAARKGDFRAVARLTSEVAQLNFALRESQRRSVEGHSTAATVS